MMIPLGVDQIGQGVIGPDQFELDLVIHAHNKVLEFSEA
jgi:hypothetical protein